MREKNKNKGITLIALVITIIVLLILAAVSIATLTGENGILTKATNTKTETTIGEEKEQIKLAYNASLTKKEYDGIVKVEELERELQKLNNETTVQKEELITVQFNKTGNIYTIDDSGIITGPVTSEMDPFITMEEARKIEKFETNTKVKDQYGNKIVIPEGFRLASDSGDVVIEGIVIEDVSDSVTQGSQFVWIPVGNVAYHDSEGANYNIELNRYTFEADGTSKEQEENLIENNYKELEISTKGNATAKNINAFKKSAIKNGGYYMGRYEARTETKRNNKTEDTTTLTVKQDDYVYNYVTQLQAASLSQNMYVNKSFTSDLMNSYAWDTAITYIQKFGQSDYSRQVSLNTSFQEKGTNYLTNTAKQDKQCNIWDMASNAVEWTTETCYHSDGPCSHVGGYYGDVVNFYTSARSSYITSAKEAYYSFRPILYL